MDVYHQFKGINGLPIKKRVAAFKATALEMISNGYDIEKIKEAVEDFEDDEMYEAAQGILEAINLN